MEYKLKGVQVMSDTIIQWILLGIAIIVLPITSICMYYMIKDLFRR